jgi:hypothetical protein
MVKAGDMVLAQFPADDESRCAVVVLGKAQATSDAHEACCLLFRSQVWLACRSLNLESRRHSAWLLVGLQALAPT